MKTPCYKCQLRQENCHAGCGAYKEYRQWLDEQKEKEAEKNRPELEARGRRQEVMNHFLRTGCQPSRGYQLAKARSRR